MLTFEAAQAMAREYVAQFSDDDLVVLYEPIVERDFGWVFGYQCKQFFQSKEISVALAGNAPLLINKHKGTLFVLGTAYPLDFYIQNYERFGDPHKVASSKVELTSRGKSVQSIEAIRCVRDYTGMGLADAKSTVEKCIAGEEPFVECRSSEDASRFVDDLARLGYIANQLGE